MSGRIVSRRISFGGALVLAALGACKPDPPKPEAQTLPFERTIATREGVSLACKVARASGGGSHSLPGGSSCNMTYAVRAMTEGGVLDVQLGARETASCAPMLEACSHAQVTEASRIDADAAVVVFARKGVKEGTAVVYVPKDGSPFLWPCVHDPVDIGTVPPLDAALAAALTGRDGCKDARGLTRILSSGSWLARHAADVGEAIDRCRVDQPVMVRALRQSTPPDALARVLSVAVGTAPCSRAALSALDEVVPAGLDAQVTAKLAACEKGCPPETVARLAFLAGKSGARDSVSTLDKLAVAKTNDQDLAHEVQLQASRALVTLDPERARRTLPATLDLHCKVLDAAVPDFTPSKLVPPTKEDGFDWRHQGHIEEHVGRLMMLADSPAWRKALAALATNPTKCVSGRRIAAAVLYDLGDPDAKKLLDRPELFTPALRKELLRQRGVVE